MKAILDIIISVFLTVGTVFSLLPDMLGRVTTYSPEDDGVILNCAVVSDTHADGNIFRDRTDKLRNVFAGISECSEKIDVLLNIGDITNSGTRIEYNNLRKLERAYLKADNIVACMGNHDSWNQSADPDYDEAKRLYLKYVSGNGVETGSVYYSTVIGGCHFICLGTERIDHDEDMPLYSDEQLSWFDAQLTEAEKSGMPVFVLSHIPVPGKNGIGTTTLPGRVDEIMQSHASADAPIVFFSGHYHDFSPAMFDSENDVYYVNMPSAEYNDETIGECNDNGGMGLVMEVYDGKIVLRARNFIKDQWAEGYRYEISF